ncbi:MAG: RIP metalloprotease RseP [Bacteroidota bacterium]
MFLAIVWSEVGMVVAKLLLSLSILVVLHEFGHYITARWFGCRVEKFYLFFDPWFSILKKKIGQTEYGIGWLPLGGYVKIAGMIDESMDKEQLALPPKPDEFRSKPAWQRLIIMLGGVTVNVLVAFIIYAGILMVWGEKKVPIATMKYGIAIQDSVMYDMGFKDGDRILAANGEKIDDYYDIVKKVIVSENVTVERDGKVQILELPVNFIGKLVEKKKSNTPLISPRIPAILGEVPDTMSSYKAGLRTGDLIVAIDSTPVLYFDMLRGLLRSKSGTTAAVQIKRDGKDMMVICPISDKGALGVYPLLSMKEMEDAGVLKVEEKKYGFFEAIPAGISLAGEQLSFYINQFKKILSPKTEAYKGLGGFKSMANIFPKTEWDWESFWNITAFFSIILAFMNLLPIPALDGGHVLFTLVEMITGRKPNPKFLEYAQIAGMILLLALMLYANGNDWFGWGKNR